MSHWNYGRRTVAELLKSGQAVRELLIADGCEPSTLTEILNLAKQKNITHRRVTRKALNMLVHGNHQGVAVRVEPVGMTDFKTFINNLKITKETFICLLDEIQDPQNLGAIIRSAVCFGCSAIILPKWRSATLSPGVMKASSGAMAHCELVEIANLNVAIERLKDKGFFIYGADASPSAESVQSIQLDFPLALIMGNEQRGIKPILKNACDKTISIPQKKTVASLNVSAASAVLFYKIASQL